jgi:hypothetical protein
MMFDDDDALDAALFALPLEEPPADLRASILSATIYRPAPLFSRREIIVLGTLTGILVWGILAIALGGGDLFRRTLEATGDALGGALANWTTLGWLAAGGATAIWLTIFTPFQSPAKVRSPERS